jgi:hypothetical protein
MITLQRERSLSEDIEPMVKENYKDALAAITKFYNSRCEKEIDGLIQGKELRKGEMGDLLKQLLNESAYRAALPSLDALFAQQKNRLSMASVKSFLAARITRSSIVR